MCLRAALCLLLTSCVVKPLDVTGKHCMSSADCGDGFTCARNACRSTTCTNGVPEVCDGFDNDCNGVVDDVPGCLLTLAGSAPGLVDGTAASGAVGGPGFLSPGTGGVLWFADRYAHAVRRIDMDGTITTVAGTGRCGFSNGPAASAQLCLPYEVVEGAGGVLFISDSGNDAIRKLEGGMLTTVAGTQLRQPRGLHVLPDGTLLIADSGNHRIRALSMAGAFSTYAGTGARGTADGMPLAMQLDTPTDITAPPSGDPLYVSEHHRVRRIPAGATSSTLAGTESNGVMDGTGTQALFDTPLQIALDLPGTKLWLADFKNDRLRSITVPGAVTDSVVSGPGGYHNGSVLTSALTRGTTGVAVLSNGDVIFSDVGHVRRLATNDVTDLAGGRWDEQSKDGPALEALLSAPRALSRLDDGTWLWVEAQANLVRALWPDGGVETLAGNLATFEPGTGDAAFGAATVDNPRDVAAVGQKAYVADWDNHVIRLFDFGNRTVSVYAGAVKTPGTSMGALLDARFDNPNSLAATAGVLYVGDEGSHLLRKIDVGSGMVTNFAGDGSGNITDGCGATAALRSMDAMAADGAGNLWVTDGFFSTMVRHVDLASHCVTTLYDNLGGHVQSLAFEPPSSLLAAVEGRLLKLAVDGGTPVTLFPPPSNKSPIGWQDGELDAGAVWELTGVALDGRDIVLVDGTANRLRRLTR